LITNRSLFVTLDYDGTGGIMNKQSRIGRLIASDFYRWRKLVIHTQTSSGIDHDTIAYGRILGYLEMNSDHDVYQKEIEQHEELNKSTVSMILTSLEKKGLVRRESVNFDARLKRIVLTEEGRVVNRKLVKAFDDCDNEIYGGNLTEEEMDTLILLLEKVASGIRQKEENIKHD